MVNVELDYSMNVKGKRKGSVKGSVMGSFLGSNVKIGSLKQVSTCFQTFSNTQ